jgi:hypothetical protein
MSHSAHADEAWLLLTQGLRLQLLKFEAGAQKSIPSARLFVLTNHKLSESLKQMYYSSSMPF